MNVVIPWLKNHRSIKPSIEECEIDGFLKKAKEAMEELKD